jgi:gamma-glutamylcyclotransferase (GGCT)/AIG2-like uncharacterized protein YtfP
MGAGGRLALNVFTYGSLMYPQVWDRVVRGRYRSVSARVSGYRRLAVRDESYPGVVARAGSVVDGRLYFDVSDEDLARLDAFETDEYHRQEVQAQLLEPGGGTVGAQLYVFLRAELLSGQDWDADRFVREQLADFVARHTSRGAATG